MLEPSAIGSGDREDGGGADIWPLYVGLFLALLTFFIVMVALSPPEAGRTAAVLDGVQKAFAPESPSPPPTVPEDGLFLAGRSALAELGGDLAGLIRLARVEHDRRGDEVRVRIPLSEIFASGSAEPLPGALPFVDRIVAALGAPPAGLRLSVTFLLGRTPSPGRSARDRDGAVDALAIERCGALARALVDRGAPAGTVAVGLEPGAAGEALFDLRMRRAPRPPGEAEAGSS